MILAIRILAKCGWCMRVCVCVCVMLKSEPIKVSEVNRKRNLICARNDLTAVYFSAVVSAYKWKEIPRTHTSFE